MKIKTVTIGHEGNPFVTLCKGHVNARQFNAAFKAEGWCSDWVKKSDILHEYWVPLKNGWKKSTISNKKAKAVTVNYW